jgi:hypothetical protein
MKSYREVPSRTLTSFFGSKLDGISLSQARPFDFYSAQENHLAGTVPSYPTDEGGRRFRRKMAFTAEEMHHHFAIEALGKPGRFRSQPYLYTCVRCKWRFRINDPRGSIIALDGLGRQLPEPENTKRALTFHLGPCSAFPNVEYMVPEPQHSFTLAELVGFLSRAIRVIGTSIRRRRGNRQYPFQSPPTAPAIFFPACANTSARHRHP